MRFALIFLFVASAASAAETEDLRPRVYVGAYLSDVSDFDLKAGQFRADLQVWCKWRGSADVPPIELRNALIDQKDEVARESDGDWHMVRWHMQGTFRGTFPLQRFPFDTQNLKLELGLIDPSRQLVADLAGSGMSPQFSITGWLYDPYFRAEKLEQSLPSDLGSVRSEGQPYSQQSIALVLTLRRPFASYILKFVLPLSIIIAMALLSFFLPAKELEVRAGMVVTSLLSCVAFHFSQADSLPDVSYLVAADKLFLASYCVIILALVGTVISYRREEHSSDASRRFDRRALPALALSIALAMVIILINAPEPPPPLPPAPAMHGAVKGPVLRIGVTALKTLSGFNNGLLRRGLTGIDEHGDKVPFALLEVPDMTNSSVRFLPDGGMRVLWMLRPGLKFSDGRPITSRDVVFSLGLVSEPDRKSLSAIDDRTVEALWTRRTPAGLKEATLFEAESSEDTFKDGGRDAVTERARSTPLPFDGPYRIASFEPDKHARFEPNPYFAGDAPKFSAIEVSVFPTAEALAEAFSAGQVDFAPTVPISALSKLAQDPRLAQRVQVAENVYVLVPDLSVPALAKPEVRRALLMAIDRKAYARELFADESLVTDTYRAKAESDHADVPVTPFDPVQARKTLETAGVLPLELPLYVDDVPADSPAGKAAAGIVRDLAAVGVTLDLKPVKSGLGDLINKREHKGLVLATRGTTLSPSRLFNLPVIGGKVIVKPIAPHFTEELSDLVNGYDESLFPERKESISARLQRAFAETLPMLPLCYGRDQSVYVKRLHGFAPVQRSNYWNVEAWSLDGE